MQLGRKHRNDVMTFLVHPAGSHVVSVCPVTVVDVHPLVKEVSARFLHSQVSMFPFVINLPLSF